MMAVSGRLRFILIQIICRSLFVPNQSRRIFLRMVGLPVGNSVINSGVFIKSENVRIGDGCFINHDVYFDHGASITISDNVSVGMGARFITSTHVFGPPSNRAPAGSWNPRPIIIESGAWIGAASIILPGVTVHKGAIVAAGSVVTRDVPSNCLVAGNPARIMREL